MIEEIDTNSNFAKKELPEGSNTFRVLATRKGEKGMYIWTFSYDGGKEGEMVFFGSNMGPLLKVLGCKENPEKPGFYTLDTSITDGGQFKATVYSEASTKDPKKIYKNMKDFDEVPF